MRRALIFVLLLAGCAARQAESPPTQPPPPQSSCKTSDTEWVNYNSDQSLPTACENYASRIAKKDAEEAAKAHKIEEREEKRAKAKEEKQHLKEQREAELAAYNASPIQSKEIFIRDITITNKMEPVDHEALRDCAHDGVMLAQPEMIVLHLITDEQWHAISQLAAFGVWLDANGVKMHGDGWQLQQREWLDWAVTLKVINHVLVIPVPGFPAYSGDNPAIITPNP